MGVAPAEKAPMWPDFSVEKRDVEIYDSRRDIKQVYWAGSTCTLRPPVKDGRGQTFTVLVAVDPGVEESFIRERLRVRLVTEYLKAHPNNCANTPAEFLDLDTSGVGWPD